MSQQASQAFYEKGLLPDAVLRLGIRRLLKQRLNEIGVNDVEYIALTEQAFLEAMRAEAIAVVPEKANQQHYELPAAFFQRILGQHRKYSCAYWPAGVENLQEAELAALRVTCERAGLANRQRILELGCGWGSLSLYMAANYPNSDVTAISNSHSQRAFILEQAAARQLNNLHVITADMNDFQADGVFDRIVSVEMFEHMRNWERLFQRVHGWLAPEGRFFMHVFVHRSTPYLFEDQGPSDWMSRYFFSGGMMPSADLPLRCAGELALKQRWFWSGRHYAKTCEAWLRNMDQRRAKLKPLFDTTYGQDFSDLWWQRWRLFFMACAELFNFNDGQEWFIGHYLFGK